MKLRNWILLGSLSTLTLSGFCLAGNGDSGGGDIYAQDFNMIGRSLVRNYQLLGIPSDAGMTAEKLSAAVEETVIVTVEETRLGDRVVDAINYPNQRIIKLNRTRWESMPDDRERKTAIALHEYLQIAGANDDNYQISSVVLENLRPLLVQPQKPQHFLCNVEIFKQSYGVKGRLESNPHTGWITVGVFDSGTYRREVNLNNLANPWDAGDLAEYSVFFDAQSDYLHPGIPPVLAYKIVKFNSSSYHEYSNVTVVQDWKQVDFSILERGAFSVVVPLINLGIEKAPATPDSYMRCYRY